MPWGIPKALGGESQANTSKMDRCVQHVMARGMPKDRAAAICKSSLGFTNDRAERVAVGQRRAAGKR